MNFFNLSALRMFQMGMGLITTYVLAHSLSVEKYGEYQFLLNVVGILSIFTLTEYSNTLMQSVARGYEGSFWKMMPHPFFCSFIASVILAGFGIYHSFQFGHYDLTVCFFIAAALFPFSYGISNWRGFKIGKEQFFQYTAFETGGLILTQLGLIACAYFVKGDYKLQFLWFCLVPAFLNILVTSLIARTLPRDAPVENDVISHGFKSSVYISLSVASNYADKILLFYFLHPAALAIYIAAERIPDLLRSAVQDAASSLAPRFASTAAYSKELDRFFKIFCLIFGIGLAILGFTIIPFLLKFIYGSKYSDSIPYMQVLMFAAAIGNLNSLQFRFIRSKLDTRNVKKIIIFTSLFRMLLSLTFIPFIGLKGAVLSNVIYRIVLSVYTNHIIKKHY